MPFFSFSLKKNFLDKNQFYYLPIENIQKNHRYFSKNTTLWKNLRKKKHSDLLNFLSFEERKKNLSLGKSILFCLPPNLGLGDIIEYSLFIEALIKSNKFLKVGLAFVGKYEFIVKNYFNIKYTYADVISELDFKKFETIFHVTLEIDEFKMQKYIRSDIEKILIKYFNIKKTKKIKKTTYKKNLKRITIFPISQSPIRSMPPSAINSLINFYQKNYSIDIILDNESDISKYIEKNLIPGKYDIIKPSNLIQLCHLVEKIDFGIFMDSGPLHLAKLLNKKGVLIVTTVSHSVLLNKENLIVPVKNNFSSPYCYAPCGLTNIFNYEGKCGCFFSLKLKKNKLNEKVNLNSLQRGKIKDSYKSLMSNPVGCVKNINMKILFETINSSIIK